MELIPIAIGLLAVGAPVLWLFGECAGSLLGRRVGAVMWALSWSAAAGLSTHFANLSVRFDAASRLTGGFHRYLLAIDDRLAAGDVAHVRTELAEVREGWLQATPSTSLYLSDLDRRTESMRAGGK